MLTGLIYLLALAVVTLLVLAVRKCSSDVDLLYRVHMEYVGTTGMRIQGAVQAIEQQLVMIKDLQSKFSNNLVASPTEVQEMRLELVKCLQQIDDLQVHCSKFGKSLQNVQKEVNLKRPLIDFPKGRLQVEIFQPPKNLGKVKKGKLHA